MSHAHTHILPGKPQSVTSQEHLNHSGDSDGGCLWALLLILKLALLPSSMFFQSVCNFLSYLCNLHISSCKPQSTKLSWLICTHSGFLLFHGLSLFLQTCSGFLCFSPSPHGFPIPCNAVFIFFLHTLLCHLHSSMSLGFSYACSSPTLDGSTFSKYSCESKECK